MFLSPPTSPGGAGATPSSSTHHTVPPLFTNPFAKSCVPSLPNRPGFLPLASLFSSRNATEFSVDLFFSPFVVKRPHFYLLRDGVAWGMRPPPDPILLIVPYNSLSFPLPLLSLVKGSLRLGLLTTPPTI